MVMTVERYLRGGLHDVRGWLTPSSASLISDISACQLALGVSGAVAEIGVHHGKLSLLLMLLADGKTAYAIDVFGLQEFNTDGSGAGNKAAFLSNVKRIVGPTSKLVVIETSSMNLKAEDVPEPVRLFSVDGGHTVECTISDLEFAASRLVDGGVVILDDVFNENWPEVSDGLARYLRDNPLIVPFAVSSNKVYLCSEQWRAHYRAALRAKSGHGYDRSLRVFNFEADIYGMRGARRDYVGYAVDRFNGLLSRFV